MFIFPLADDKLAAKLTGRKLLSHAEEWAVRPAAHAAVQQVVKESGKSMGAVDWFFFQPVRRMSFYQALWFASNFSITAVS